MAAKDTASASGIGLGAAIAVTVSWSLYHSLWLYVIYYALTRK
jgi:hypothetical protein